MEVIIMKSNKTFFVCAIAFALGGKSVFVNAQQVTGFTAEAEVRLSHDDNIFRTPDELSQSDALINLNPELKLVGGLGKHRFQITYDGSYAKHADINDADYADHSLSFQADFDHSTKLKTRFEAAFIDEHQDPGVINRVQLDLEEYNLFKEKRIGASLFYGSSESIGRIELKYRNSDIDFTNNNLDFLDQNRQNFGAKFIYRLSPKTRTYAEVTYIDFDFSPPVGQVDQDHVNTTYSAGFSWDFANKLTGDVNVGYQELDFSSQQFRSTSGLTYDGSINWEISELTELEVSASRQALSSTIEEVGSFTREAFGLELTHKFTERLMFEADIAFFNEDIELLLVRNDERYSYNLSLMYDVTPKISLGGSFANSRRDSTLPFAEFESNLFSFIFSIQL